MLSVGLEMFAAPSLKPPGFTLVVLWQPAQVSAVTARWLIFVPAKLVKLVVEWQPSHGVGGVPTGIWVGGMPVADTPLWQLAQLLVTPTWLNIAPPQLSVV